jgi:N-acetylneuraminate lyase
MSHFSAGLLSAPYTPFREDGALDLDRIATQVEAATRSLDGAFICGTTGEGVSLTVQERMAVAERWASLRGESLRLIVHVGNSCIEDARTLARHAEGIGADAVAALAPAAFRVESAGDLVRYCSLIAAAAPQTPFYYYHMPSMNGVSLDMRRTVRLLAESIPTFRGVKYTHEDLIEFALLIEEFGDRYDLVFGRDELLLPALMVGARGAVGSTYNYLTAPYRALIAAVNAGDMETARTSYLDVLRFISVLIRHGGGVVGGKAIMGLIGMDLGPCRPPLRTLTAEQVDALRRDLEAVGFFDMVDSSIFTGSA